jgi:hypothetical protein
MGLRLESRPVSPPFVVSESRLSGMLSGRRSRRAPVVGYCGGLRSEPSVESVFREFVAR